MRVCTWCHIDLMWCSKKDPCVRTSTFQNGNKYFLLWSHTVREIRFLFYDYNERMKGERGGGRGERGEGRGRKGITKSLLLLVLSFHEPHMFWVDTCTGIFA